MFLICVMAGKVSHGPATLKNSSSFVLSQEFLARPTAEDFTRPNDGKIALLILCSVE